MARGDDHLHGLLQPLQLLRERLHRRRLLLHDLAQLRRLRLRARLLPPRRRRRRHRLRRLAPRCLRSGLCRCQPPRRQLGTTAGGTGRARGARRAGGACWAPRVAGRTLLGLGLGAALRRLAAAAAEDSAQACKPASSTRASGRASGRAPTPARISGHRGRRGSLQLRRLHRRRPRLLHRLYRRRRRRLYLRRRRRRSLRWWHMGRRGGSGGLLGGSGLGLGGHGATLPGTREARREEVLCLLV